MRWPSEPKKIRPGGALANGKVDCSRRPRCQRDCHDLAAFAQHSHDAVAALDAEGLDVGADGFGDPQVVRSQQRNEGVLGRGAQPGGNQQ
jgi:hypothetical protein